jgi:hypothetical protein
VAVASTVAGGAVGVDLGALGALAHPATHIPAKAADINRREPSMASVRNGRSSL